MTSFSYRSLLALAVPSIVFAVLTNAYRLVDQYWIKTVSMESQAAIGSCVFVLIVYFGLFTLFAGGAAPLVARATGAADPTVRRRVIGNAITGLVACSVAIAVAGGLGASLLADALGLEGRTHAECVRYLQALSLTALPLALTPLVDQCFISIGSARVPMVLHGISLALNMVLTPLLIHEAGLGIVGAALASNLSRAVTTGIGLAVLVRRAGVTWSDLRPGPELTRVARVGTPVTAGVVSYALVYVAMLKTSVSPLGPEVNAALGIGFSALEGVAWPTYHGVALAVASFVGRGLGADRPEIAWSAVRNSIPIVVALGLIATLAFWLGGETLTAFFADDPAVHRAATEYAVILAWSQLAVALDTLFIGVLQGAGDTKRAFWISVPLNVVRIPLAWAMSAPAALGMGAAGIWWAINATTYAKTALSIGAVVRGKWAKLDI